MFSQHEATEAVRAVLLNQGSSEVAVDVREYQECWAVTAQSKAWARSRDPRDMLIGRGPFIVNKATGEVHQTGSGLPEADAVEAVRLWGNPYGPPPLTDSHRALLDLVAERSGRRRTRDLELLAHGRGNLWAATTPELLADLHRRGLIESQDDCWSLTDEGHRVQTRSS